MAGTLAAKVRAKYPGVYDDLDDATLEKQVLAKHPEYADLVEPAPPLEGLTGLSKAQSIKGPMSSLDKLLSWLPTLGGATGGIIGGTGGTAFGMGFGGVPGATAGAAFGGATGEAMRQNARRILGGNREVPTSSGEAAKDISLEGGMQALMELGGHGAVRGLKSGATAIHRGYLKPSLAKASLAKGDRIVQTAIDEALPVTKAGEMRANTVIGELRQEVDRILAAKPGNVDLHQVAERVRAFAKRKYFKPGKPTADFDAAMKVADELDQHPSIQNPFAPNSPAPVNLSKANEVKRGLDESIGDSNFGVDRGATKTTQKQARRYVRQDIEALAPEVGPLNAREGALVETAKALARATGRESNKSPLIGVNTLLSGAVGGGTYAKTGDPYAAAVSALALRGALAPGVMTRATLVASRLGKIHGGVPANVARIAVRAVLAEDEGDGQP